MSPPNDTETPLPSIPPNRFRVTLTSPTPVAHPELEVEAENEDAAWKAFCAANDITDSVHPRMIVPL